MHLSFLLLMRTSALQWWRYFKAFRYIWTKLNNNRKKNISNILYVGISFLATFDFQKDESLLILSLLVLVLVFVWAHSEVIFSSTQERAWRGWNEQTIINTIINIIKFNKDMDILSQGYWIGSSHPYHYLQLLCTFPAFLLHLLYFSVQLHGPVVWPESFFCTAL